MRRDTVARAAAGNDRVAAVELVCAEHFHRTLLMCDEATSFQRIVSQAVAARRGEWGFEQHRPFDSGRCSGDALRLRGTALRGVKDDRVWMGDACRVLQRREEFMKNEGRLLHLMAVASKGIRRSSEVLYPSKEVTAPDNLHT